MDKLTIHQCFGKAQQEFPLVKKDANNPFFKSKYAPLPNVLEVVMPVLHKNGLYLTQEPINEGDRIGIRTKIVHINSGEFIESSFTVVLAKNDPQGAGSALTYCRRYALVSMLGLNVEDDDDANHASAKQPVTKPTAHAETVMNVVNDLDFLN